jgi:hypothetical protein
MDAQRFRSLSPRQRALVALAVLLDGHEAGLYLENDAVNGAGLKRAAAELAALEPDLRMPYVGSVLRSALKELR